MDGQIFLELKRPAVLQISDVPQAMLGGTTLEGDVGANVAVVTLSRVSSF